MTDANERIYLRPTGLVHATTAQRALAEAEGRFSGALPLCGDGPFDFLGLEVITRQGIAVTRRMCASGEMWDSDISPALAPAHQTLQRLTTPRRRIAGLRMDRPQIMGVVNVTPDSFSDGGQFASSAQAVAHGLRLVSEGASLLDIGGESTRPGSMATPLEIELARVLPVIEGLASQTDVLISIDTRKAEVARRALDAGAHIINDVTAMTYDPAMLEVAAESGVPFVLMHALGDFQRNPRKRFAQAGQRIMQNPFSQSRNVIARIRAPAGQHLEITDPQGVHVRRRCRRLTLIQFRGHIRRRPDEFLPAARLGTLQQNPPRETEIDDLRHPLMRQQHVVRLQVAVQNVDLVRGGKPLGDAQRERRRPLR